MRPMLVVMARMDMKHVLEVAATENEQPVEALATRRPDPFRESHTERQTTLLVRADGHVYDSRWEQHEVDLEEIVLAYLGYLPGNGAFTTPALEAVLS